MDKIFQVFLVNNELLMISRYVYGMFVLVYILGQFYGCYYIVLVFSMYYYGIRRMIML